MDHQKAKEELIEAEYKTNMLETAVFAFTHRRSQLENLIGLYRGNYFAGPKEPRELDEGKRMLDKAKSKEENKQRKELNTRRRRRT